MTKIIQKENKTLRETAKEVELSEIRSPKIQKILLSMSKALKAEEDGVALAAPQIDIPLRIFIISGKLFSQSEKKIKPDLVFINPKITKLSKKLSLMEEGCLSVRWLYGFVKRADKATVEAYDENGKKFSRSGSGLLAQIFQHEIDHLNGILFIDKARNIKEFIDESKSPKNKDYEQPII